MATDVKITTLANGVRVATDPIAWVDSVSIGVWIGTGARYESPEQNGMAHLLEHMAFKGTHKRSAFEIARDIEDVGGYLNAYTGREITAYYARILPNHIALTVDILADILQNSVFDADELDRERSVILQEMGQVLDTPDDIIFDHFQSTAYPNQGAGQPVIGTKDVIERVSSADLHAYLQKHYDPARMIICAAGQVDHTELVAMAEQAFGNWQPHAPYALDQAQYQGGDFRDHKAHLEQAHLVLGFEGAGYSHDDYFTASVLATLFGGGMSSRLFQEVREKRGLVYGVSAFMSCLRETGLFSVYAGTGGEQLPELVLVLGDSFKALTETITEDEIARAKAQQTASLLMARESTTARCESLAHHLLGLGHILDSEAMVEKINAVSQENLHKMAQALLAGPMTVAAIGPLALLPEAGVLEQVYQV